MKAWLLRDPELTGALLGSVALALARFLALQFVSTRILPGGEDTSVAVVWGLPGFLWGWVLGGRAGLVIDAWREGRLEKARDICRVDGLVYCILNGSWAGLVLFFVVWGVDGWGAKCFAAGCYLFTNSCLQASVVMLFAGYVLFRERAVQVTENLRL